jgi:hypothetical protein
VAGILASVDSDDCEGIGDTSSDHLTESTDIVDEIFELAHLDTFANGLAPNPTDIARKTLDLRARDFAAPCLVRLSMIVNAACAGRQDEPGRPGFR